MKRLAFWLASLGGLGKSPKMPGTVGSIVAILLAPYLFLPFSLLTRLMILIIIFFVGAWSAKIVEKNMKIKDPSVVIIDELVGQWLTIFFISKASSWLILLIGLILFRLFDIKKPWIVGKSEHWLPDGYGVMIDDVLAGLFGFLFLFLISYFFKF